MYYPTPRSKGINVSHSKCANWLETFLDLHPLGGECTDWKKVTILLSLGIVYLAINNTFPFHCMNKQYLMVLLAVLCCCLMIPLVQFGFYYM